MSDRVHTVGGVAVDLTLWGRGWGVAEFTLWGRREWQNSNCGGVAEFTLCCYLAGSESATLVPALYDTL